MRRTYSLLTIVVFPFALSAQDVAAPAPTPHPIAPTERQIAAAVIPLPNEFRAGATVLGYDEAGTLVTLRKGAGAMICLADDPKDENFHAACYHRSMEPFMARGRALRKAGTTGSAVDSARFRAVRAGKLRMPTRPAALWQVSGPHSAIDIDKQTHAAPARSLYVVYIPGATPESTGLPGRGAAGLPWVMNPGTPKAHIMFVPTM